MAPTPTSRLSSFPVQYSVTGQTLHFDPSVPANTIAADGGTSTNNFLQRYYGGSLAAAETPTTQRRANRSYSPACAAGPTASPSEVILKTPNSMHCKSRLPSSSARALPSPATTSGLHAFGDTSNLWTWSHSLTHLRDSQVRAQQLTTYGSYDLPFGKGKQFAQNVNRLTDEIIGGYQLSFVTTWSGGLPFTASATTSAVRTSTTVPIRPPAADAFPMQPEKCPQRLTSFVAQLERHGYTDLLPGANH